MKLELFNRESSWCYRSHGITVIADRKLPTTDNMHAEPIDLYNIRIEYTRCAEMSEFSHELGIEGSLAPQELVNMKLQHGSVEELIISAAKWLDIPIT